MTHSPVKRTKSMRRSCERIVPPPLTMTGADDGAVSVMISGSNGTSLEFPKLTVTDGDRAVLVHDAGQWQLLFDEDGDGTTDQTTHFEELAWRGHGSEHIDRDCAGRVEWQVLLTKQPGGTEAALTVEFVDSGIAAAQGVMRGEGASGAIHFEVWTPAGDAVVSASAIISGDALPNHVLTPGETVCHQ